MSKRFHDTKIWSEDWFISLPKDYRTFWMYLKDDCDHAGIWRPKVAMFNKLNDCSINLDTALDLLNTGSNVDGKRILLLENGHWFLTGFIPFQYGHTLNMANRVHASVFAVLQKEGVNLTSIRPQLDLTQGLKDKDKDKDTLRIINKECKLCHGSGKIIAQGTGKSKDCWECVKKGE